MKSRQQDFLLGLVVIVFLALFLVTILFIYPNIGENTRAVVIEFDLENGVAPVKPGNEVVLGGALRVGHVTRLSRKEVPPAPPRYPHQRLLIVIEAEIDADLKLYEDCSITTDQPAVGGAGFVVILDVGTPVNPEVGDGPIEGMPPQSLAATIGALSRRLLMPNGFMDQIEQMIDPETEGSMAHQIARSLNDINVITAGLRTEMSSADQRALLGKIHLVFDQIAAMTASLREQTATSDPASLMAKVHVALDQLGGALSDAAAMLDENRPGIRRALASVEHSVAQLDEELLPALKAEFDRNDPASLLGKIHTGVDRIHVSLDNLVVTTDTTKKLVLLNRPALQKTIDNLKNVSDQMRVGMQEILLAPWRLFRPDNTELQKIDVLEAARRFAEAANTLDDAAARLEAVAQSPAEDQLFTSTDELAEIRAGLEQAFERFQVAEQYFWDSMK